MLAASNSAAQVSIFMGRQQDMRRRKLVRSADRMVIAGVCAGLADHYQFNLSLTRLLAIIALFIAPPLTVIGYLGAALFVPVDPDTRAAADLKTGSTGGTAFLLVILQLATLVIVVGPAAGATILGILGMCPECGQKFADDWLPPVWVLFPLVLLCAASWLLLFRRKYGIAEMVSTLPLLVALGVGLAYFF